MKKLYSLLILPIISVIMFYGCGSSKRTVAEVEAIYTKMSETYAVEDGSCHDGNWYFSTKSVGELTKPTFRVIFDNSKDINNLVYGANEIDNKPLLHKYEQLMSIYQRTLTMAFHYYSNWSEVFYNTIDNKKIKDKEISKLYDKFKSLQRELEVFNVEKQNFEREVGLFGNDSSILSASIDKLNYRYTTLIKSTLNFVNYFKDLHVSYYFNDEVQVDAAYAERVYDEGILQLANYIYYDYLLALTRNSTTQTYYLTDDISNNIYDIFNYNSASKPNKLSKVVPVSTITKFTKTSIVNVGGLKSAFLQSLTNSDGTINESKALQVKQYEVSLNTFKQYFKLYQKVYQSVSMEGLNNFRFKTSNGFGINNHIEDYLATLTTVDVANARILLDFEQNKIYSFLDSLIEYRELN